MSDLYETPFMDDWPKISFECFEQVEIENKAARVAYRSFFKLLRLPEATLKAFYIILFS